MTSPSKQALISAIICTYNRAPLLRQALEAVCTQTLPLQHLELIVVDDGSSDDTAEVIRSFTDRLPLRAIHQDNSGLAAAKNRGIAAATTPLVVFLDDDDVLDCECLEQHYRSHQQFPDEDIAVLGYTDLLPAVAHSPLMRYVTGKAGLLFNYSPLSDGDMLDFTHFWGGRSSCKRALLERHGVFNPVFRFGAEDIELGYRLSATGLKVLYNRRAISHMVRSLEFDEFCRRSYLQGRSNQVFADLHPDPVIVKYTGMAEAEQEWERIAPRYTRLLKTGRDLHRFAIERTNRSLPVDGISTRLLHNAYHSAFKASMLKGLIDAANDAPTTPGLVTPGP